jgi:hypothetical protein
VFKVLWSEPTGAGGTEITERGGGGKNGAFQKHRRFVIVDTRKGHSICLPILTYGGQGTLKYGVHPEDHAPIYSSRRDGPCLLEGEQPGKEAIRVEVIDLSHKLDPMSRLNYAKLYTVEHNVKVFFIGKIAKSSEQKVVDAYNDVHRPLPARPELVAEMTDDNFKHAEGPEPSYPKQDSYSSAWNWNPWTWSSSTARNPNQSSHDPPSAEDPEYNTETLQDGENIYDAEE